MTIPASRLTIFSGFVLTIIAILTYFKQKEELEMKKEEFNLNKELAQLKINSIKNQIKNGTFDPTA